MFNNLGIFSNRVILPGLPIHRGGRCVPYLTRVAATGMQIGGPGNDNININGSGIPGPPGPPGPPGTPGLVPVTTVTTTPFVAALTDYYLAVNVTEAASIVLPVAPVGTVFVVKDIDGDSSINPITITGLGALVDGVASATINADYGSLSFVFNGVEWNII